MFLLLLEDILRIIVNSIAWLRYKKILLINRESWEKSFKDVDLDSYGTFNEELWVERSKNSLKNLYVFSAGVDYDQI